MDFIKREYKEKIKEKRKNQEGDFVLDIYTAKSKRKIIKGNSPKSPVFKNCILSFVFGGLICALGELLFVFYSKYVEDKALASLLVTISVIVLASVLTALGIFDEIAKRAGAGTLVPVSGFSNALTSIAIDSRSEGLILGVGSKLFTVAGPVIVWGTLAGVLYGTVYYLYLLFI